ncbi:MAG: hypothetical protein Q7S11_03525 [bacterium]|nr:hypothetical protein [bacterium]
MEYTKEKFKKLPQNIQQLLLSDDVGIDVQLIGRDTGITPEQALDVEDEVVSVLMGTSHPKDFIRNIVTKIDVDQEKARAIAEKVNEEIFQPVKESLKIVHNIIDEGASPQASLASEASVASIPTPPQAPTPPMSPSPQFPQMIVPGGTSAPEAPKPPETPKAPQNIFEQKLQGVFKMPREETLVPQKPSSAPVPPTPPRPSGVDPYREPAK